jgi:hypothetical protein
MQITITSHKNQLKNIITSNHAQIWNLLHSHIHGRQHMVGLKFFHLSTNYIISNTKFLILHNLGRNQLRNKHMKLRRVNIPTLPCNSNLKEFWCGNQRIQEPTFPSIQITIFQTIARALQPLTLLPFSTSFDCVFYIDPHSHSPLETNLEDKKKKKKAQKALLSPSLLLLGHCP